MTLQSQHQENTSPNNYFLPNGSVCTRLWVLSSLPIRRKDLSLLSIIIYKWIPCFATHLKNESRKINKRKIQ